MSQNSNEGPQDEGAGGFTRPEAGPLQARSLYGSHSLLAEMQKIYKQRDDILNAVLDSIQMRPVKKEGE